MKPVREQFSQPLPAWIDEIKDKAKAKINGSTFAAACREGNVNVMRELVVGLWPFVDEFPKTIVRATSHLSKKSLLKDRELLNTLLHRGSEILAGIRKDEQNHRKLWLETGQALGLHFPLDYEQPVLPETQTWIGAVNAEAEPVTSFLRFAAIEIIAETVSADFLPSKAFTLVLGERGCEWFRVHAEHEPGMTHEELELRLAFAFLEDSANREQTNAIIQGIVDLFVAAAEASARLDHVSFREVPSP